MCAVFWGLKWFLVGLFLVFGPPATDFGIFIRFVNEHELKLMESIMGIESIIKSHVGEGNNIVGLEMGNVLLVRLS